MDFAYAAINRTFRTFTRLLQWDKGSTSRILILLSWVMRILGLYQKSDDGRGQICD